MPKPCLTIVFNHRYDKNIQVLKKIYSPRFSTVLFLVPFYNGNDPDVIPVYASSHQFQSFFAQGYNKFYQKYFTHYIFVADDCLLNPSINENNFLQQTGLHEGADFIPGIFELHKRDGWWHTQNAISFLQDNQGAEIEKELPSKEEALKRFAKHGIIIQPLTKQNIFGNEKVSYLRGWQSLIYKEFFLRMKWKQYKTNGKIELPYPVVGSYSDLLIVTKENITGFCHYCGVLASAGLFAEIAIPTSLLLSSTKIMQEKDLQLQGKAIWSDEELTKMENKFKKSLAALLNEFRADQLYCHPVKLSKWNNDL